MQRLLFIVLLTFYINSLYSQDIIWKKCLGGNSDDYLQAIVQTNDSGYMVAGYSCSHDGDVSGNHGNFDYWIVKLNILGNIQWQKCYGGTNPDRAQSIVKTFDGGCVVAGSSMSNNGDVTGNHGNYDYWVIKLDNIGNLQWQKCFGGTNEDRARSIAQTKDTGYIVAGFSKSNDGDVSNNNGRFDYWIVKLDSLGNLQWEKNLGGIVEDYAMSVIQCYDNCFVVAGKVDSPDGYDVSGQHGSSDYWIIKLDTTGNLLWQKCLGGTKSDYAYSIKQTTDSGFIVVGSSFSNNWDVSGNHGPKDNWVVKLDSDANIQWQRCFGGSQWDGGVDINQTNDGGFIITGGTKSNDGNVSACHGSNDIWNLKLDNIGNIEWEKSFGGSNWEHGNSIIQTFDDKYVFGGSTSSIDGDVIGKHAGIDYWLIKINIPISVDFSVSDTLINLGDTIQFTDLSVGTSTHLQWNFGDGIIDSIQNPAHIYQSAGIYTVSFSVYDSSDCYTSTKESLIAVLPFSHQNTELLSGWNIVSFNIIPDSLNMINILQTLIDSSNLIKTIDESGNFIQFIPGYGWMNTIGNMANTEGYYLKVLFYDSLGTKGNNVSIPFNIPLLSGWNIIGYPLQDTNNAISILQDLIDSSFLIKVIDESGGFVQYIPGFGWMNTIGVFKPGEGYYLKVNTNCSLTVDTNWQCGNLLIDIRDGHSYNTKLYGNQCWMTENLNIGTRINGALDQLDNDTIEKYCYNDIDTNCNKYGGLYLWDEMKQYTPEPTTQGICPSGWHIPSDSEWKELEGTVDSQYPIGDSIWDAEGYRGYDVGINLKSVTGWKYGGGGTDIYDFRVIPAGFRNSNGSFLKMGEYAWFWTSSLTHPFISNGAWYRDIRYNYNNIARLGQFKAYYGLSVRCIKD